MRQLSENEIAKEGDWFYGFLTGLGWIRLGPEPKPMFRKTIGELDNENKFPHCPIIVMRPTWVEYLFKTQPTDKPCAHGYLDWDKCPDCCH